MHLYTESINVELIYDKFTILFPKVKEFMKGRQFADDQKGLSARQMASWKSKINSSSTTESELWRNAGPSAFQLHETMSKNGKI